MTRSAVDRRGDLRGGDLLTRLLADPDTRVLRLRGDAVAVHEDETGALTLALGAPEPADADRLVVYLGEASGVAHLGVVTEVVEGLEGGPPPGTMTLRQAGARIDDVGAALFATLLALANWHSTHRFCPRCGAPTRPELSGWIRRCTLDGTDHYPRTDVAVIVAVVDAADRILLARGQGFRHRGMSVLAGFLEPGETMAAAVVREVAEEVGVTVEEVTYLGDQPWPFPSSMMVGFTARARSTELVLQDAEIASARWFSRQDLVAAIEAGEVLLPGRVSIARRLIEHWFGGPLDAPEVTSMR